VRSWTRIVTASATALVMAFALSAAGLTSSGAPAKGKWTAEAVLPMTCVQAWLAANKNYSQMLAIVVIEARISLTNRGLTFPNSREAGLDAGKGIAEDCKADPNGLLFAIVDGHFRRVAEDLK
jgi:hypothetical protein